MREILTFTYEIVVECYQDYESDSLAAFKLQIFIHILAAFFLFVLPAG